MSTYAPSHGKTGTAHPLDPPTAAEIEAAVAVARADERLPEATRFWGATLDEFHARSVIDGEVSTPSRRITLVAMPGGGADAWEVTVELTADLAGEAVDWKAVPHNRPGITSEEARLAAQACRDDADFQAALAKRGIDDPSLVMIDPESIGGFEAEQWKGRRLAWGTVWSKPDAEDNGYARPVQGVVPMIDLTTMEVLEVEDHGVVEMSEESGSIEPGAWGPERPGLKDARHHPARRPELHRRRARKVSWQGWELRVGFNQREGLVLHDLTFMGRPVMLPRLASPRWSCPYGDPNVHPVLAELLRLRRVPVGPARQLARARLRLPRRHPLPRRRGHRRRRQRRASIPNAICMHEEDYSAPLEAHRHPHRLGQVAPRPPAGRLVLQHRRQLRLRLLLVPLPRRHDRARGEADRDAFGVRDRARRGGALRDRRLPSASRPRTTSTTSRCGSTRRSTV